MRYKWYTEKQYLNIMEIKTGKIWQSLKEIIYLNKIKTGKLMFIPNISNRIMPSDKIVIFDLHKNRTKLKQA